MINYIQKNAQKSHAERKIMSKKPLCKIIKSRHKKTNFILPCVLATLTVASSIAAVTSKITRHRTHADLLKGKTMNTVISSDGTIQLSRHWELLKKDFGDVWAINAIVVTPSALYLGTSPNGAIYKYTLDKWTQLYPLPTPQAPNQPQQPPDLPETTEPTDTNQPGQPKIINQQQHLINEHIFAMKIDFSGRLLAAISGDKCCLLRIQPGKIETVFEPNDAKYIFDIALDDKGNIFLATGPAGKIYQLDSLAEKPALIYDCDDKNVLSLATDDLGFLYAGTDTRGLIYKINPRQKTAEILYDSDLPEISNLIITEQRELFAAATSAQIEESEAQFASKISLSGRPENTAENKNNSETLKLQVPNTKPEAQTPPHPAAPRPTPHARPKKNSYIYKITPKGYVTPVLEESAVFFDLASRNRHLLIATGNSGQLLSLDVPAQRAAIIYQNEKTPQISAVTVAEKNIYLGTANPPQLIVLEDSLAEQGTFTSDLIDAAQPAQWGKLQLEADIPNHCQVLMTTRTGNVKDINDPTFSEWTKPVQLKKPAQITSPLARFCQYKLILRSQNPKNTPLIRQIAVASSIPNLSPLLEAVTIIPTGQDNEKGIFKIDYKASDRNNDKLTYEIHFRKILAKTWIQLEEQTETNSFKWDAKTVEDGRYEIKVTASDLQDNTSKTELTDSRVSDPVIVDNTPPIIKNLSVLQPDPNIIVTLTVTDELSTVAKLDYTIDSRTDYQGTLPDDRVYDTTEENFEIHIENLKPGPHIIALRCTDAAGNTIYKTIPVDITENKPDEKN